MTMAPGHLIILLEINCFPYIEQCEHLQHDIKHSTILISNLLSEKLVEYDGRAHPHGDPPVSGYRMTDKGRCFVTGLCQLPLPTQTWEIPI